MSSEYQVHIKITQSLGGVNLPHRYCFGFELSLTYANLRHFCFRDPTKGEISQANAGAGIL